VGIFDDTVAAVNAEGAAKERADADARVEKARLAKVQADLVHDYLETRLKPILLEYVAAARQTNVQTRTFEIEGEPLSAAGYLVRIEEKHDGVDDYYNNWFMDERLRFWRDGSVSSIEDFFNSFGFRGIDSGSREADWSRLDGLFTDRLKQCLQKGVA
jgi:hypothetical protein